MKLPNHFDWSFASESCPWNSNLILPMATGLTMHKYKANFTTKWNFFCDTFQDVWGQRPKTYMFASYMNWAFDPRPAPGRRLKTKLLLSFGFHFLFWLLYCPLSVLTWPSFHVEYAMLSYFLPQHLLSSQWKFLTWNAIYDVYSV